MKILDTCVWIEATLATATGKRYERLLHDTEQLIMPTLVCYELRRWALREYGFKHADKLQAGLQAMALAPLDILIALRAADLADIYKLSTADAIIYATALRHNAELVTCDAHFKGLPSVDYTPKIAP